MCVQNCEAQISLKIRWPFLQAPWIIPHFSARR